MIIRLVIFACSILLLTGCTSDETILNESTWPALMEIPKAFPPMPEPVDNVFTQERWELGRILFFDKRLSIDQSISCENCHKQALAFSDDKAQSLGVEDRPGFRNSPSLANIGYHPYFTREGGIQTLEQQIAIPIQEHNEFNNNIVELSELLRADPEINQRALEAYNRPFDPFVLTRAISCFERSFISGSSPFDDFNTGVNFDALSTEALRGMDLFLSDSLACSHCHSGFNFTNYAFENNGLYQNYEDSGRYRLTLDTSDIARFKVPSLRNIALTAPYMHNGSMEDLETVIEHYASGGFDHVHKSDLIKGFEISEADKTALIAFLESLSDEEFISNPLFSAP
jgi:cytochrome c peroxidase